VPAAAQARIPIRVGIGDQSTAMFDEPAFQAMKLERVRYLFRWNGMDDDRTRLAARAYVKRARAAGMSVLVHLTTDDYDIKEGHLPSVSEYRTKVRRLVRYFRTLGVREFGTWDEANHASQPTYRSPTRAADFFREMYRAVKARCRSCGVVALDLLDQTGVERYIRSFMLHLSGTYRHRATVIGLHNYGDVNRNRTRYTSSMIRSVHRYDRGARFWITETGALVNFGRSFPCDTGRAADRIGNAFTLANRYRRSGVERLYLYSWNGPGCDARFDAGLTNPDHTTRPAYRVVRKRLGSYIR
jgi:hypothetical protein